MAIKEIDKATLELLKPAVLAKLNETLGAEFGLHFSFNGGNYTATSAVMKLQIAVKDASGAVVSRERESFTKHGVLYGLKPEWLDTTFRDFSGKEFKIVGLNTKRRSYPVIIQPVAGGRQRIAPASYVKQAKERQNG